MEIGGKEIKALSSDTRVMMLKSLVERRKMPSELSRELKLTPSTIVEHLQVLERSGLIKKIETGHKWRYYELTEKGRSLVKPRFPMQFVVMLSLGVMMVFGSLASMLVNSAPALQASEYAGAPVIEKCATASAPLMETAPKAAFLVDGMLLAVLVIGILLIIFAAVKLWSKWK
jgi:DNA-binding transcriptional ArsR family regulator